MSVKSATDSHFRFKIDMTKQEFINRVMLIMNEAAMADSQGQLIMGADNAQVDRYIESSYIDAWRRCVKVMPREWFENKSFKSSVTKSDLTDGTGYIELPKDFYLLTKFQMEGWVKAVFSASIENERNSNIQSNEYTRGSVLRPVAVIGTEEVGNVMKPVLKYYSLKKGLTTHSVKSAIYLPVPKPLKDMDMDADIKISDQAVEPLAYLLGSSVYTMFEKYDIAKALEMRAAEMYPGLIIDVKGISTIKQ